MCVFCDRVFTKKATLRDHVRRHTGNNRNCLIACCYALLIPIFCSQARNHSDVIFAAKGSHNGISLTPTKESTQVKIRQKIRQKFTAQFYSNFGADIQLRFQANARLNALSVDDRSPLRPFSKIIV